MQTATGPGQLVPHRYLSQMLFVALAIGYAIWVMTQTSETYHAGPITVVVVALTISFASMNLVALLFEQRLMINPRTQYLSFLIGDTVCLPLTALVVARAVQDLPAGDYWWESTNWTIACVAFAALTAGIFRLSDWRVYAASWFESPAKIWHEFAVWPAFAFFLLNQAPALVEGGIQVWRVFAIVALLGLWAYLGLSIDVTRSQRGKEPLWKQAHVSYFWPRWPKRR